MFAPERHKLILEHLRQHGAATLRELSVLTGSSEVTTRRDLRALEAEGRLRRRHGGAVLEQPGPAQEPPYAAKARVAAAEKAAIAAAAAARVRPGDAIVIGPGTTTRALARRLVEQTDLTVVTNSLLVTDALLDATHVDVLVTGGTLRGSIHALVGPGAEHALAGLRAVRAFLSGNGLTAERGLTTPNSLVGSADRAIAAAAREVVVLADSTKVGYDTMVQTVPAEAMTDLIVDDGADPAELERLRAAGVRVEVVTPLPAPVADVLDLPAAVAPDRLRSGLSGSIRP
jgi:DeoR/GlpR family transcriptional regulator of sugar metabolism